MAFPAMVAMVGRIRAPHSTRVADTGSDIGTDSDGVRDNCAVAADGNMDLCQ